jgi:hypothetical protein
MIYRRLVGHVIGVVCTVVFLSSSVLLRAQPDSRSHVYRPELGSEEYEFTWVMTPKRMKIDFPGVRLWQQIGADRHVGVKASLSSCDSCDEYGIHPSLNRSDDTTYTLHLEADIAKLKSSAKALLRGRNFQFDIDMVGPDGTKGMTFLNVMVSVEGRGFEAPR